MSGSGESSGNEERWLLTYSDMITLLLGYFVILYSISNTDLKKFEQLAAGVRRGFNMISVNLFESSTTGSEGNAAGFIAGIPEISRDFLRISSELTNYARSHNLNGDVNVNMRPEGVVVSVSTSLLFNSGSADIRPESTTTLDAVAALLKPLPNEVRIAGHTDDLSPYPQYPSNWELSSGRAVTVLRYLIDRDGIAPRRLSAVGYADNQPLRPNDSPEHRAVNRRVEILIVYPSGGNDVINPFGEVSKGKTPSAAP
jgi:chemotaxis protein MotB